MVCMAHPTDMAIAECHDFATHQGFPSIPAVAAVRAEREITAVKRALAVWFQAPCEPAGRVYAGAAGQRGEIMPVRPPVHCRLP